MSKLVFERLGKFFRFNFYIKYYAESLFDAEDEVLKTIKKTLPFSETEILAIFAQNMMHPRNSHRTDAIEKESYKDIKDEASAKDFLDQICLRMAK